MFWNSDSGLVLGENQDLTNKTYVDRVIKVGTKFLAIADEEHSIQDK